MTRLSAFISCLLLWLSPIFGQSYGQPTLSDDLKKPEKYENRKLGSEKSADKKFHFFRRFTQNGVTKFNWHFNANEKLDQVIARAKALHKDDYTKLLSFYNYDLDITSQEKVELDSVIDKANTGILLHDLRNTWIDNLYMLMGKAYYFKKELDTAYLTFQYINYAFSPKEKDGYDIPIGSNATEGGNAFTISTKEKDDLLHKAWSRPPSRNESFIWQIRTYIAAGQMAEAAGLIETLRNDPNFPDRLQADLNEVKSLWFYNRQSYDSSAIYLEKALDNATTREEKARWEYLIAQLYERSNKSENAEKFYQRTIKHTLDPVLEVHARLNAIRQNKGDKKAIDENIEKLTKMAKRDRYRNYRDIIYYMAARIELERDNIDGAKAFLLKATQVANSEVSRKDEAFLTLATLSFEQKQYADAKRFYDSVQAPDPEVISPEILEKRKGTLGLIVEQLNIIQRQDSLQAIAAMPEAGRNDFLRKLSRKLRKQQGLKEEETGGPDVNFNDPNNKTVDLFQSNKGEWYFYNNALKSKGSSTFKANWGNRPNVDNWRRTNAINRNANQQQNIVSADNGGKSDAAVQNPVTFDELLKSLPLTQEQMKKSNDSVENARFLLGKAYLDGLEDYTSTIENDEIFTGQFTYSDHLPEVLFRLYYCYYKLGNDAKADAMAAQLKQQYPNSSFEKIVSNPATPSADSLAKTEMTDHYETIYNLFIEGNLDAALAEKHIADSIYGNHYWTPQLLYIQSIVLIKERKDAMAKKELENIIELYGQHPLAEKASTMLDVLNRRKEIETYLTNLQIERPTEDSAVITHQPFERKIVVVNQPASPQVKADSATVQQPPVVKTNPPVQQPPVVQQSDEKPLQDSAIAAAPKNNNPPPATVKKPVADNKTDSVVVKAPVTGNFYIPDTTAAHFVVLVLDKVDPVFVNEARNAFSRYNREKFSNLPIEIFNTAISDDLKLMLMNSFSNSAAAIAYMERVRKDAPREVIPWLPAAKYSFLVISSHNLEVLKNSKDINAYKQFLGNLFPGKF